MTRNQRLRARAIAASNDPRPRIKLLLLFFAATSFVLLLLSSLSAFAQATAPMVAVPDTAPTHACYGVPGPIYGPYSMSFCMYNGGTGIYRVVGGGLDCQGGLVWSQSGSTINVQLYQSQCGAGMVWTADRMTCQSTFAFDPYLAAPAPNVAVPAPAPDGQTMQCSYYPSAPGYPPSTVYAYYQPW